MGMSFAQRCGRRAGTTLLIACMAAIGSTLSAPPASAHGDGETTEGYLLVQQALGHLAHDTSIEGIAIATEKVNDALKTKDQSGVDPADLRQAKADLEAGDVDQARSLLQRSISGAISQLKSATGEETGTGSVLLPQPGRGPMSIGEGGLILLFVVLLLLGVGFAWRFRPHDNMHELRQRLGPPGRTVGDELAQPTSEDAPSLR